MALAAICKLDLTPCDLVHFYCSDKDSSALFSGVFGYRTLTLIPPCRRHLLG